MKNIIEKIKEIRIAKRYSQEDLAEKLNINQSTYFKIENGKTELTITRIYEIAKILEVSVSELLGIGPNNVPEMDNSELEYWEKEVEWRSELLKSQRDSIRLVELKKQELQILVNNTFIKVAFDKAIEMKIVKNGTNEENFRFLERLSKDDLELLYREKLYKIPFMYHTIRLNAVESARYFTSFHNDFFESNLADYWQTPFDLGK